MGYQKWLIEFGSQSSKSLRSGSSQLGENLESWIYTYGDGLPIEGKQDQLRDVLKENLNPSEYDEHASEAEAEFLR